MVSNRGFTLSPKTLKGALQAENGADDFLVTVQVSDTTGATTEKKRLVTKKPETGVDL